MLIQKYIGNEHVKVKISLHFLHSSVNCTDDTNITWPIEIYMYIPEHRNLRVVFNL
jgi:hypothetical protein